MAKTNKIKTKIQNSLAIIIVLLVAVLCTAFILCGDKSENGSITLDGKDAKIEAYTDTFIENSNELLGMYVRQDSGSSEEQLPQMGSFPYYKVDVSTPTAFVNAVIGVGFDEGYGKQCVAGFKEFMYSLSGKVVATSTGGASGYAGQQSQIEPLGFTWHAGAAGLQNGDWGIFGGGQYGHVAMYYNGQWFGQNQGAADANAGNAFNLSNMGTSNLLGYYRPNIYVATPTPEPTPEPTPVSYDSYTVVRGDTLGQIALDMGWCNGCKLFGDDGYAQALAEYNNIKNRGIIFPGQIIRRK